MNLELVKEPIYQQLNQRLRRLLSSGEFGVGARFLTERQIAERFQVSRPTANKVLSSLVSEGLLEFRKGVGTFVRGSALDYNLRALVSFTAEALAAGKRPATQVLRFLTVTAARAPGEVSTLLGTAAGGELFYMERLRLADAMPVILERRWVVAALCPGLNAGDAQGSLYSVWSERYRLVLEGADQRIRAVAIRHGDARALEVRSGSAGLLVTSAGYLAGGRPLWFERTLYRGDTYEFHNRLAGALATARAAGKFLDAETRS